MPFLQAIFCLKGCDDRNRFFVTSTLCLVGFTFLSAIFSSYFAISFALLLLLAIVLICSTKRRLHDAKLNKNWQLVPGILFLITGIICLIMGAGSSYYLLIFPVLTIALLLTYPSKNNQTGTPYILGYYGPVDLSQYKEKPVVAKVQRQRIEPTLSSNERTAHVNLADTAVHSKNNQGIEQTLHSNGYTNEQTDLGELIRLTLLNNRKVQLGLIMSVSLIFIVVLFTSLFTSFNKPTVSVTRVDASELPPVITQESAVIINEKQHLLSMPDNFNLYQSTHQGIIIHWQADNVNDGELWSLTTGIGDKTCSKISFNKGKPIRPLFVFVENASEYFANFSPLDSQELIQALAYSGKFSLCDYHFSLKGSQAKLGKMSEYAKYLAK